jgi:hypothetical protein
MLTALSGSTELAEVLSKGGALEQWNKRAIWEAKCSIAV